MAETDKPQPGNGYLNALWAIGCALTVLGAIMWFANSTEPNSGTEEALVLQAVGGSLLGAGVSFIALGLVAAAVCQQIRVSAKR
jgi:hypothetical protein